MCPLYRPGEFKKIVLTVVKVDRASYKNVQLKMSNRKMSLVQPPAQSRVTSELRPGFDLQSLSLILLPYQEIGSIFSKKTTPSCWKTVYIPPSLLFSGFRDSSCSVTLLPDVCHQLPNRKEVLLIPSASQ